MTQESTGRTPTDPPLAPEVALPGGRRPTTSSTRVDPMLGRRLGSYEILSRVARGGMGVVYRARHVYIDKIVAVKVLDPALAGREDLIERFRTEAQSLARVEHENVVKVIDIIEDKGVHGIVMDFAEGVNLRQLVKERGPLQPEDLLSVARQTAEALYSAHREGILHRDIKPENLIRNSRGRCKLADFGLAGDLRLIAEGHEGPLNFGTPAYSAPEVLRRLVPDKRSDIFSFGATMYHLAAGEPPFGQSGLSQIMLSQTQGARPLESRRPDLPPKLCKLLMECISLHPKDRPESFAEILERLPRRAHNRPPGAPTEPTDLLATASGPLPLPREKARNWYSRAALVAVAVLVAVLAAWWFSTRGQPGANQITDLPSNNPPVQPDSDPASNQPPTNAPGPLFLPHEQAFAAAELGSRTALARADYVGAWQAFAAFLLTYPDAPDSSVARQQQSAVRTRVEELRDLAWQATLQSCESALAASRTADALAALDGFPSELLKPLWATEDIKAARLLQTQRELVLGREEAELAGVLKRADELHLEWKEAVAAMPPTPDARALRAAANRIAERELLIAFLPGRTAQAREVVNLRLAELRRQLEAEHQAARAAPVAWRQFCSRVRPEWARQALAIRTDVDAHLAERKFEAARDRIDSHLAALARTRASAAQTAPPAVGKRIAEQRELEDLLARWRDDIVQAEKCNLAILGALRRNRLTGANMTYRFHAGLDEKGRRLPRTDSHTGKVMTVGARDFEVDGERGRATIRLDLLTVECVRDLVKVSTNFEEQFSLVSWLFALGRIELATAEADRLQRKAGVPEDIARRTAEMAASGMHSPFPQRRLQFMVAMAAGAGFEPGWDTQSLEARLLAAQRELAAGVAGAAEGYLALVRDLTEPELVHLESLQTALDATSAGASDRRLRVMLEPWDAGAHAQLARALAQADQRDSARHAARQALLLDPSHEEAFAVLRELDR